MGRWTRVVDGVAFDRALGLAKGSYQLDLLWGRHNLSGSSLRGRAKNYGGKYSRSRQALLRRMTAEGIPWDEERGDNGARILVIGSPACGAPGCSPEFMVGYVEGVES